MDTALNFFGKHTLSAFSRANCINNESITWDNTLNEDWWMGVDSVHQSSAGDLDYFSCDVHGKRCGAVSWLGGASFSKTWMVEGNHFMSYDSDSQRDFLMSWCTQGWSDSGPGQHWTSGVCRYTSATSCNITDW